MLWYFMGQDKDKLVMLGRMCARVSWTPEYRLIDRGEDGKCWCTMGTVPVDMHMCFSLSKTSCSSVLVCVGVTV